MEGIGGLHGWQWIVCLFRTNVLYLVNIIPTVQFCLEGLGMFLTRHHPTSFLILKSATIVVGILSYFFIYDVSLIIFIYQISALTAIHSAQKRHPSLRNMRDRLSFKWSKRTDRVLQLTTMQNLSGKLCWTTNPISRL